MTTMLGGYNGKDHNFVYEQFNNRLTSGELLSNARLYQMVGLKEGNG